MTVIIIYLQELQMAHDLSSEIIYEISKKNDFPEYLISNYIDDLEEFHFSNDLQISRCKTNTRDILISSGRVAAFYGALEFLYESTDLTELLLVNRQSYAQLKQVVYKTVLLKEHLPARLRIDIWAGRMAIKVFLYLYMVYRYSVLYI